ncbi:MAG: sigma-54-dependent Fis family transcriptional regulator [Phycisphaerae bacterium]|nr:sigma-54-dependent Fis family transcriptional regulator [Phycisphaerae bacterium]
MVVDDDAIVADSLGSFLRERGYDVTVVYDYQSAVESLERSESADSTIPAFDAIVADIAMPGANASPNSGQGGMDLIRLVRTRDWTPVVVAITGYGTVESAVEAIREGASDYLTKPVMDEELVLAIERGIQRHALVREPKAPRIPLEQGGLESIVGNDPRMHRIYDLVRAVAPTRTTVLMTGESGTGKSLIARAIHRHSPRAEKPYVELSCGSIPETLLESELFGHVKGAFTGAHADKKGRFLAAHGGTLFLDEINSASPSMQLKLLRVLQERRFEPVGSPETIEVDVRVILASNQPLEQLVASGQFRQDLYYRINVVAIELPPLRDRVADIPSLAEHFLRLQCIEHHRQIAGFTPEAVELLCRYPFPGNVRELENVVERAVVLARGGMIQPGDLPPTVLHGTGLRVRGGDRPHAIGEWDGGWSHPIGSVRPTSQASEQNRPQAPSEWGRGDSRDDRNSEPWVPIKLEDALREPERQILLRALKANHWNRSRAAEQLGIDRTTLYKKMKQLGISSADAA